MKQRSKLKLSAIFALCGVLSACGQAPEPKNDFERAVYSESRLDSDKKTDDYRKPATILAFANVTKGMVVADLSAGGGYYTELLSLMVGEQGTVYYHNKPSWASKEKNKKKINKRINGNRLSNVEQVIDELNTYSLPQKADLIVLSKIYHDLFVPAESDERTTFNSEFMENLKRNLKAGGKVLLIDHSAKDGSGISSTKATHRIDRLFVKAEFENAGFKLAASTDALKNASDDTSKNIWESKEFPNTDRFVMLFER